GAPVEAGAEADEADQVAGLDAAALAALVERDGNRGGRRVPVLLDVVVDALVRKPQGALDDLVDAQIRLVRNEQVDLGYRDSLFLAQLANDLGHARHGELEDGAPVHLGN